jgi:hypothetical protein
MIEIGIRVEVKATVKVGLQSSMFCPKQFQSSIDLGSADSFIFEFGRIFFKNLLLRQRKVVLLLQLLGEIFPKFEVEFVLRSLADCENGTQKRRKQENENSSTHPHNHSPEHFFGHLLFRRDSLGKLFNKTLCQLAKGQTKTAMWNTVCL